MRALACILAWVLSLSTLALAQTINVVGYNTESGGADPDIVAQRIVNFDGVDIWGFSEVRNASWADKFETAAEDGESANFEAILGTTGSADKLLIVYDADRFEEVTHFEIDNINVGGHVRAPLVVQLKIKSSGEDFLFMVNHLYRSRANRRHEQARLLNDWAKVQHLPIITVGDYNFDWSVPDGDTDHDQGYDELVKDGVFRWVRPATIVKTQDSSHNSLLDFVFVAGNAKSWGVTESVVVVVAGDFPDSNQTSDHRPVEATFNLAASGGNTPSAADIANARKLVRDAIARLETELKRMRDLLDLLGG